MPGDSGRPGPPLQPGVKDLSQRHSLSSPVMGCPQLQWEMTAARTGSACRSSCCGVAKGFFHSSSLPVLQGTSLCQGRGSPPSPVLAGLDSQLSLAHLTLRRGSLRVLGALPYSALLLLAGPRSQSSAHHSGALVSGR